MSWIDITIGVAAGAALGATGGFLTSIALLYARRVENDRLVKRGEPPRKNLLRPRLGVPGGLVGAVTGGVLAALVTLPVGLVTAFVAPGAIVVLTGLTLRITRA